MDHSDLVAELPRVEKMTAAERLKIARERRANQLRIYEQHERQFSSKSNKSMINQRTKHLRTKNRNVRFIHSVMLLEAAARNDIEEVRRLLMQGVSPDSTNEDGLTALHQCCIDDSESMMKLLLEFGANVNAEDSEKWTPLHAAATCGHFHLVRYLICKSANLLAVNADGNMPYDICEDESTLHYIESEMARQGVTQELIDQTRASTERLMLSELKQIAAKGGSLEYSDSVGARPLHIAAANGYLSVVEFLLDHHVATDSKDNDGWQPIHAAACWLHLEVVELLVQNGADLNAQTKNQETPYDICEDLELKARIAALRTEQEVRARADQQKNRRQSGSTNTRTHSIRRNSTRDKSQISKKQIKDEALARIQNDNLSMGDPREQYSNPQSSMEIPVNKHSDNMQQQIDDIMESKKKQAPPPPSTKTKALSGVSPIVTASTLRDNKIDIHVSVTINTSTPSVSPVLPAVPASLSVSGVACTLADLKRHRSQSRILVTPSQLPVAPCSVNSLQSAFLFPAVGSLNEPINGINSSTATTKPVHPHHESIIQSANGAKEEGAIKSFTNLPVFKGETTELVGSKHSETSCCILS